MPRMLTWGLVLSTVILGAALYVGPVQATPPSDYASSTIAKGRFGDIDVSNHVFVDGLWNPDPRQNPWLSFQRTKGPSDLYVQRNTWKPGGRTGWHTHPGHSLIIVTAGTVTAYEGDDETCTPHEYGTGMGFVDPGGEHVHLLRNEHPVEAQTVAVQLIPAGADRRIDADANPACSF